MCRDIKMLLLLGYSLNATIYLIVKNLLFKSEILSSSFTMASYANLYFQKIQKNARTTKIYPC